MKRISIVFFSTFLMIFVGLVIFVGLSPDFEEPSSGMSQEEYGIDENSPVWSMTIDDLAEYFMENGMISSLEYDILSDGIATVARKYGGIEIYWWDLENLAEDSDEFRAFTEMSESGMIDLWSSGIMMGAIRQGPFGICLSGYDGNIDELVEVYHKFGVE